MSGCLKENLTSHAFDGILSYPGLYMTSSVYTGYEVIWEELYDSVQCVYTLTDPVTDQVCNITTYNNNVPYCQLFHLQLQCTDVSWSSSGAMLVASYPSL